MELVIPCKELSETLSTAMCGMRWGWCDGRGGAEARGEGREQEMDRRRRRRNGGSEIASNQAPPCLP
eukprot:760327-Hanusia_phi.AAC.15